MAEPFDCLIVGGGPAGLTAAIYLARFHLDVRVVDSGESRALWIPRTHNHAGFPGGIGGADLIARCREQAVSFGASIAAGRVTRLERDGKGFAAEWGEGPVRARTVLLATGVKNRRPAIDEDLHERALCEGRLRYCPVCDGYEVTDCNVGVIGTGAQAIGEAVFLRGFTRQVTLIAPDGPHDPDPAFRQRAAACGIALIDGPSRVAGIADREILIETPGGVARFDSVYPALGSDTNSDLAIAIGADVSDAGCIVVDSHQRTNVPGLYAAGDVVIGLDQISHAMGEAGVAATTIRNDLAEIAPLLR